MFPGSEKLSPQLTIFLMDLPPQEDPKVVILVGCEGHVTTERRSRMEIAGCEIRSVVGDVVTANIASRALDRLTVLEFVTYIQLSRPLAFETKQPGE